MKNILLIIVSVSLLLSSCKKEELNGDLAYLEGKWKLTILINNASGSYYPPSDERTVYYLEFEKEGRIKLYDYENKLIERGRIVSHTSQQSSFYANGIDYEVKIASNSIFNRKLNNINSIKLISINAIPLEIITNDFRKIYETSVLDLVFQKD